MEYDYKCAQCGKVTIRKLMLDPNPTACPKCGGGITRVFSAPPVAVRGTHYVGQYKEHKSSGSAQIEPRTA